MITTLFLITMMLLQEKTTHATSIKSMELYNDIDRIFKDLQFNHGYSENDDKYDVSVLNNYDCYNYGGRNAAVSVAEQFRIHSKSKVLDVGSGIGGPARAIASVTEATVIGVELQEDVMQLSTFLTKKSNLDKNVQFINKNILDIQETDEFMNLNSFDFAVSWLTILHIPLTDRKSVFQKIHQLLKPGGKMYIEDYFWKPELGQFTDEEKEKLRKDVYVPNGELPSQVAYVRLLNSCGFSVEFEDVTETWSQFTESRLSSFKENKKRHVYVYNEKTYEALQHFYSTVVSLFESKKLGGAKIILTKL